MSCPFLVETARFDAIVASPNRMAKDIFNQYEQSHEKIERQIKLPLHDAPIVYLPQFDIERQDVWIYLSVSC